MVDKLKVRSINDRALVRLIPATYHKAPVLRGLVDSDEEYAILAELEGETSGRLIAEKHGTADLDRRELVFDRRKQDLQVYGNAHINAAFVYTRKGGNRFNGGTRGAWYCSYDLLTSVQEVGYHRTRELEYIGMYRDRARYVELLADFVGDFPEINRKSHPEVLDPDPRIGYPAGQGFALQLRRGGYKGLLYPSVRRKGGRCFVAFDPQMVQNVRPGASWELVWDGKAEFDVCALN